MLAALLVALLVAQPAASPQQGGGLAWRNLGPARGGRVVAVAGIAERPAVFYMGTTGGGVWKSDDAGTTWRNVSDGFFGTGSVGAIDVSDSDPEVIYVGMGESPYRINMSSHGDGVYRSTDGGASWTHRGLRETRQIAAIVVHPSQPSTVYVAAQGNHWAPSTDRGVYRSTDGGATWTKVLAGDNPTTGAIDLKLDPADPNVIYAAMWDHQRTAWQLRSGGPGSGIYKSGDGGATWTRLSGGLPARLGKIGIAVSPADPRRLYAAVESERAEHGLYRSDDGGRTWRLVNRSRHVSTRPWYYMHVVADPVDREVVYVPSQSFWKSTDGGVTFERIRVAHGDAHALWINPKDPRTMVLGDDGGASVTVNGGRSWSTQLNQPTAQIYRVSTDDRFPYTVYGAQQDNTTIAIKSRSDYGGVGADDYYPVGGGETGFVVPDPFDPDLVYAGSEMGTLTRFDHRTRRETTILAYPIFPEGQDPRELKHRFEVNAPIAVSRHLPGTMYHGAQHVLRSTDRGQSWQVISPDLTRNEAAHQGPGGIPFSNERIDAHNALSYLAESPLEPRILWAGSDDGLVHLTKDGGATWSAVTPPDLGEALISAIDASPHARGAAWVAANRTRSGDLSPLVYHTEDFGATWRLAVTGLPEAPVRVVREDPLRAGLLFAGTEVGVRYSADSGRVWRSVQQNLPVTPVTDLVIKGNDLVASTQGRGFWILDDFSPLRASLDHGLYPVTPAVKVAGSAGFGLTESPNPPAGAVLYYALAAPVAAGTPFRLELLDSGGVVVRRHTPRDSVAGLHRWVWDLSGTAPTRIIAAYDGVAPAYQVRSGAYRARLTVAERVFEQPVEVRSDPRIPAERSTPADEDEKYRLLADLTEVFDTMARTVNRLYGARLALDSLARAEPRTSRGRGAAALAAAIERWEAGALSRQIEDGNDRVNFGGRLAFDLIVAIDWLDRSDPPVTRGFLEVTRDLTARWRDLEIEARALGSRLRGFARSRRLGGRRPPLNHD